MVNACYRFILLGPQIEENIHAINLQEIRTLSDTDREKYLVLPASMNVMDYDAGTALLRRSLATHAALRCLHSNESEEMQKLLLDLAKTDPDCCCMILEDVVGHVLHNRDAVNAPILLVIHQMALRIDDKEVKSKAQALISKLLFEDDWRVHFFEQVDKTVTDSTLNVLNLQCLNGSPSSIESALCLYGYFLDHEFRSCQGDNHSCLQRISQYVRLLRRVLQDTNVSYNIFRPFFRLTYASSLSI